MVQLLNRASSMPHTYVLLHNITYVLLDTRMRYGIYTCSNTRALWHMHYLVHTFDTHKMHVHAAAEARETEGSRGLVSAMTCFSSYKEERM